jgi:hypothetical protein
MVARRLETKMDPPEDRTPARQSEQGETTRLPGLVERLREHWLALVGWLWAAIYLFSTRTQPLRLNWGDPWSDSHVQQHGRYFAEYGFIHNAFIAVTDVGPLRPDSLKYTHYPPLPDIINGLEQRILGPSDISTYRFFADLFALASLYFLHRWACALFGRVTAGVAMILMTTSVIWLQYADTIHHVPIYWFFGSLTLFLAERWVRAPSRTGLAMAFASILLCDMASYDWFFFVPVLVAATVWLSGGRLRDRKWWPLLLAVAGGTIGAVVLKLALVAWAVGPSTMLHDFVFQLEERATTKHSADYRGAFWLVLYHRAIRFFSPLVFLLFASQLMALGLRVVKRPVAWLPPPKSLLVLCAGIPFIGLFSQLLVEQYHPMLQFLPYYAIAGGAAVAWLSSSAARHRRVLAVLAVMGAVGWEMRELARFDKVFLERDDAKAVAGYLDANDHQVIVYTNTVVDAPFRFYFQRHGLAMTGTQAEAMPTVLDAFFLAHGADEPVHFVQFTHVEKAAFDKGLYALFARDKAWSWIADPYPHRSEWEEGVRARDRALVGIFERMGTVVLDTGRMRVIRVTRAELDAYTVRSLEESADGPSADFGGLSSARHKLTGFRYPEKYDSYGYSWTMDRQRKHYRFTMQGLLEDEYGPIEREAVAVLRATQGTRISLLAHTSEPGQELEILLNGHPCGTVDVGLAWSDRSVPIPPGALDPSGVQRITLRWTKSNEFHLGIALATLRLE